MRNLLSVVVVLGAFALSCGNKTNEQPDAGTLPPDSSSRGEGGKPDQGSSKKALGQACAADAECESAICSGAKCAKGCTAPTDCTGNQDCANDGKRLVCVELVYAKEIGTACAVTGTCPVSTMKCLGGLENAAAYCTAECADDSGCPPAFYCRELADKKKYCYRRGFCSQCTSDAQCGEGRKCVKQGTKSFCSKPCTAGKTECPRFADCKDIGGGEFGCVHKAGTCAGDGKFCSPCTGLDGDCEANALCLTFTYSMEAFCATSCATATCPTVAAAKCEEIPLSATEKVKQCVPGDDKAPTCLPGGLSPTMEVGDTMDDFAMVGYLDNNKDGSLVGEKLRVIKLSDFASSSKVILFNLSAGWCGPCQLETKDFAALMQSYESQGLMIVQTLFDSDQQGVKPTLKLLDAWVNPANKLNPAGACGIDPGRVSVPYNTAGTTPLNMLLDAKTRKVLKKLNGYSLASMKSDIEAALKSIP